MNPPTPPTVTVANAICTFCGCTCDDIVLTIEGERITQAKHACALGEAWFLGQKVDERPVALIDGRPVSFTDAVEAAAHILVNARFPLVLGLGQTTCEAQGQAVAIADLTGATIDTTAAAHDGLSGIAFQSLGKSAATLGEIRNRADLVIYWGANPSETHPRHFERYAVAPHRRNECTVIFVDARHTDSVNAGDRFMQIKPNSDFELLWAMRTLLRGRSVTPDVEEETGVSLDETRGLVERMKRCQYGAFFAGAGLLTSRGGHFNALALLGLTADLNKHTHFVVSPVYGVGNTAGAGNVLAWQTGYPFAVNFSRGYPRFNPGEFSTVNLLERGETDAALIVGSDSTSNLSTAAIEHLNRIPTIALDPNPATMTTATVSFTTATYGIHTGGTVYRMDDVPITLRPAFPSPYPSDEAVLKAIRASILDS